MGLLIKAIAGLVLLAIISITALYATGEWERRVWNQKITLDIETSDGVVSGSSIVRMEYEWKTGKNRENKEYVASSRLGIFGEAPLVDLGEDRYLVAFSLYEPYLPLQAYREEISTENNVTPGLIQAITQEKRELVLWRSHMPIIAGFEEPGDPSSMRAYRVDGSFLNAGKIYKVKAIRYQVTDEPVTKDVIATKLPWIKNWRGSFIPNSEAKTEKGVELNQFNASVLTRHRSCLIDGYILRQITREWMSSGIGCKFER